MLTMYKKDDGGESENQKKGGVRMAEEISSERVTLRGECVVLTATAKTNLDNARKALVGLERKIVNLTGHDIAMLLDQDSKRLVASGHGYDGTAEVMTKAGIPIAASTLKRRHVYEKQRNKGDVDSPAKEERTGWV